MAYVPQQIPDEEQNKFANPSPTTPLPPQGGGSSGAASAGGAAPNVGTPTQFGSNASKLSDYLTANKDQVAQFGQNFAQDLTSRYDQTKSGIDQGVNQFNSQLGTQYTPPNPNDVKSALSNPQEFTKDPNNVQKFQSWASGTYNGPENFEGTDVYSNLNSQVNKAVEDSGLTKSMSGMGQYINSNLGGANNTPGMSMLDTALLQRSPEARQSIQGAATPFSGLNSYLGNATKSADDNVQNVKNNLQQSAQDVRSQVANSETDFQNLLNSRLSNAKSDYDTYQKSIADQLANANPLESVDINAGNSVAAPTLSSAALPEDYVYQQALNKLLGNNSVNFLPQEFNKDNFYVYSHPNDAMAGIQNSLFSANPNTSPVSGQNWVGIGELEADPSSYGNLDINNPPAGFRFDQRTGWQKLV